MTSVGDTTTTVYETTPTDEELSRPSAPASRVNLLLIISDTSEMLAARSRICPMWWLYLSLAIPTVVMAWYLVWHAITEGFGPLDYCGAGIFVLAVPTLLAFLLCIVGPHLRGQRDDVFVLDKLRQVLLMPQAGLELPAGQIHSLVELQHWRLVDGDSWGWACEVTVLVRRADGGFARHRVTTTSRKNGKLLADTLARYLKVPRREFKARRVEKSFLGIVYKWMKR